MRTRHQRRAVCAAVFNVQELLKHILSFLDMRTLLVTAQRINRKCRATVKGSLSLQRTLYLRPQPPGLDPQNNDRRRNPLLVEAFPAWVEPLAEKNSRIIERADYSSLPMCASQAKKKAFLRPEASWRIMLVTQPPIHKLGCLMLYVEGGSPPDWMFKALEYTQGLRMGTLYDLCQRWASHPENMFLEIAWGPWDVAYLRRLSRSHMSNEAMDKAIRECGMAVDIILFGRTGYENRVWKKKMVHAANAFDTQFSVNDKNQGDGLLKPLEESKYAATREFAERLRA
jgi:hypothetical protein